MTKLPLYLFLGVLAFSMTAFAQQTAYTQTNLVADQAGVANHTDAQLSNPWGISFIPGNPFWIANNNGGTSTLYDAAGNKQTLVVGIPSAATSPCSPGCPSGTCATIWPYGLITAVGPRASRPSALPVTSEDISHARVSFAGMPRTRL